MLVGIGLTGIFLEQETWLVVICMARRIREFVRFVGLQTGMHRVQNYLHAFYAVFYRLMVVVVLPAELNIIFFGVLGGLIQERRIVMHL
jgi:hypothetical protein